MPALLRPLSAILCTLQPRPSKRRTLSTTVDTEPFHLAQSEPATSATPTAADTATPDDSPTLVGEEDMPIATLDSPSNTPNMHAYARAAGHDAASNGVPVSNAKGLSRADTPQVFSSIAARQAISDGARLPIPAPKPTRFGSVNHHSSRSHSGPPSQSPPHPPGPSSPTRRTRSNSNDRGVGGAATALWAPSVLSDSEFNSPTTDADASRYGRFQSQSNDVRPTLTQPPPNWNPHQSAQFSEFIIGDDGMMKVRPVPNNNGNHHHQQQQQQQQYHNPQNDYRENNHQSLDDPFEPHPIHQTHLPVRDAHPRKPYPEHPDHPINNLIDEDEMRGAIPSSFETARGLERPKHEPSNRPQNPIFGGIDEDDEDDFDMPSEPEHPTPRAPEKRAPKTLLESSLPPYVSPSSKEGRGTKRRWQSCDYDDNALSSMNYADLKDQPFDVDPTAEASPPSRGRAPGGDNSLPAKLEYYKGRQESEQRAFLGELPVADWDGAGDWFLEQFGSLVQQVRESRKRRRAVVEKFEKEIADREEGVRGRTEAVRGKLDRMKRDGLKVVMDGDV